MSTLPTDLIGSVLQSHLVQQQVSAVRDGERAGSAVDLRKQASIIDEKGNTVETSDNDTQVYTDAEGSGGQGRAFSEPDNSEPKPDQEKPPEGDEGTQLDIQA
jgi:hypothetical protein